MDFIPKSLMADVKSLKKPFQQPQKKGVEPLPAEDSRVASRQGLSKSIADTRRPRSLSTAESSKDVESVLSSASRKTKKFEEIVLPNETQSLTDLMTASTNARESSLDKMEAVAGIAKASKASLGSKSSLKSALASKNNVKSQTPAKVKVISNEPANHH